MHEDVRRLRIDVRRARGAARPRQNPLFRFPLAGLRLLERAKLRDISTRRAPFRAHRDRLVTVSRTRLPL